MNEIERTIQFCNVFLGFWASCSILSSSFGHKLEKDKDSNIFGKVPNEMYIWICTIATNPIEYILLCFLCQFQSLVNSSSTFHFYVSYFLHLLFELIGNLSLQKCNYSRTLGCIHWLLNMLTLKEVKKNTT